MPKRTIFVTGATGQQGGAVARHVLSAGLAVRVFLRNPHSPAAAALARQDVEIIVGDFSDRTSVKRGVTGAYGVFSVQPLLRGKAAVEATWGEQLADAARDAGVRHFVYSSVHGADHAPDVPHFASKARIEQHIRSIKLPATILRPAGFMENLLIPMVRKGIHKGRLTTPNVVDVPQPLIAVDDIGVVAAKAFSAPEEYIGRVLPLVGDVASANDQAEILSRVLGRRIRAGQLPGFIVRLVLGADLYRMFRWTAITGNSIPFDMNELRTIHPDLLTFESWVRKYLTQAVVPIRS